ncbi:hypothetical protein [Actinoplanes sp. NPDC051851]|uniref:hypothetical protein n=1 Tax=Actinoplanes sp. NPDC051851 TaxID=3154753 RepID=UPI00342BC43B
MIVCYAQGGGLGHLTRIRAYLHTCHPGEPATILTTSPFTADPRVLGPHRVLPAAALPSLRPSILVIDAFPFGLNGELNASAVSPGTRLVHLARLLRWDAYRTLTPAAPLHFDQTWTVEELTPPHHAFLASISGSIAPLRLTDPPVAEPLSVLAQDRWLVAHAGPLTEITELLSYASECSALERGDRRLLLVSPHPPPAPPPNVDHLSVYPAAPLFPRADRIFTAAGFNAVRQLAPWRPKHVMLPFPRRWDDQFTRATRARTP